MSLVVQMLWGFLLHCICRLVAPLRHHDVIRLSPLRGSKRSCGGQPQRTGVGPTADKGSFEIPQCSSLLPYLDVLSFAWARQHQHDSEHPKERLRAQSGAQRKADARGRSRRTKLFREIIEIADDASDVEPLAMCNPALAGDTLRGRPTPRFRTIQVCLRTSRPLCGKLRCRRRGRAAAAAP
jgi:hypothetical protein